MIPGQAQQFFEAAAAQAGGEYEIERSLRFNSDDSAYLDRTPSSASDRRTFTFSAWLKRSTLGSPRNALFNVGTSLPGDSGFFGIRFNTDNTLNVTTGSTNLLSTTRVFRDISAWYHIVVTGDTTQSSNQFKIYVNGVLDAQGGSLTVNTDLAVNNTLSHEIGRTSWSTNEYLNGYLAEVHFIDGQALAATDFGEYDDNNVWQPKEYSGSYGTNGFYLKFADNSSDAALGTDSSGNGNTWTVNNLTAVLNTGMPVSGAWTGYAGGQWASTDTWDSLSDASTNFGNNGGTKGYSSTTETWTGTKTSWAGAFGAGIRGADGWALKFSSSVTITVNPVATTTIVACPSTSTAVSAGTSYTSFPATMTGQVFWFQCSGQPGVGVYNSVALPTAAEIDSLIDTPSNYVADSGNNGGNYCTLNPLDKHSSAVLSQGNLKVEASTTQWELARSTFFLSSGKHYWEFTWTGSVTSSSGYQMGLKTPESTLSAAAAQAGSYAFQYTTIYLTDGTLNSVVISPGSTTSGDTVMFAYDADAGEMWIGVNGSWNGSGDPAAGSNPDWTLLPTTGLSPFAGCYGTTNTITLNAGQRSFAYTPPTGFKSLYTTNLPDPTIADGSTAMDVATYTGNGTNGRSVTGFNFSPDFVWIKGRAAGGSPNIQHVLQDTVRGTDVMVSSNEQYRESDFGSPPVWGYISSFDSDGFSLTAGTNGHAQTNYNTATYVGWSWDGGDLVTNSAYNQSQTWSSNTTGSFASNLEKLAFNGELSTSSTTGRVRPANGTTAGFTFSSLGTVTSLKIWVHRGGTGGTVFTVNGTDVTSTVDAATNDSFVDFGSTFTSLTAITFNAVDSSNWYSIAGVEVNGKLLVDTGVIPVGSLNSSFYNQDENWSTTSGVGSASNAFDGSLSTGGVVSSSGSAITITTSSFTATKIRLYKNGNNDATLTKITVNGTDYTFPQQATATGWVEADLGSSTTVTSFTTTWSAGAYTLYAVEVDDKILVDTTASPPDVPAISSTVRANTTSGFSIVSYNGNSTVGATIGHGLNAQPSLVIIKNRDRSTNWVVGHSAVDGFSSGKQLYLNLTNSFASSENFFNGTAPKSSVFTVKDNYEVNYASEDYIAYCFAPVEGYSKFGSYEGNGATDGTFVYTGFRPKFVLLKNADNGNTGYDWHINDTERNPYNVSDSYLNANKNDAEQTYVAIDFLSNGFKLRNSGGSYNQSSQTFVYACFAEHPFKTTRAR